MIKITNKKDCCGCSACYNECKRDAIEMVPDEEGFLYPSVNMELCNNCGRCEKVCPFLNSFDKVSPVKIDAFKISDKTIHRTSTSGGAFTAIANIVLNKGGVVFGVRYNEKWQATYAKVETHEGLEAFRGPKYVQSSVGTAYAECCKELKIGRLVLFSGTPCQIAGLKLFLRKEYDNLLTVEVICHGAPSPKVWDAYISSLAGETTNIKRINLRNKIGDGVNRYYIAGKNKVYFDAPAATSLFSQGFIRDYYLRPSCSSCKVKQGSSLADFTIGDCWGIKKVNADFHSKYGVSTIIFNSMRSMGLRDSIMSQGRSIDIDVNFVIKNNPSYKYPAMMSASRAYFWNQFKSNGIDAISATIKRDNNIIRKIINKIKSLI